MDIDTIASRTHRMTYTWSDPAVARARVLGGEKIRFSLLQMTEIYVTNLCLLHQGYRRHRLLTRCSALMFIITTLEDLRLH
jgi:hypothetical protein